MATVPQAGHLIRLPPWRLVAPAVTPGHVAMVAESFSGQVPSPRYLPIAATPSFLGLAKGESGPWYGDPGNVVSMPRRTQAGHSIRVPPRVVQVLNLIPEDVPALQALVGPQLEAAGVWCFGFAAIPADYLSLMDVMPIAARAETVTTLEFTLHNAGGEVIADGTDTRTWPYVTLHDGSRFAGREVLVIGVGQYDRYALTAYGQEGSFQPDPIGHPEIVEWNWDYAMEDFPEVRVPDKAALLAAKGIFGRLAYRIISKFAGSGYARPPGTHSPADSQFDAMTAAVNALGRANLDDLFTGTDYQRHYFDVTTEALEDLIDVPGTIAGWIREFYPEAF